MSGCALSHTLGGEGDAGRDRPDSGPGRVDAGGGVIACGGFAGLMCDAGFYCDLGAACFTPDAGGVCRPIPDGCDDLWDPVCGCDGVTYGNDCEAASAGQSVLHRGECDEPPPPFCEPQRAEGVGVCGAFFGYRWDGERCEGVGGCDCEGPDCASLYPDPESCLWEHVDCIEPVCEPWDAAGRGPCDAEFGWRWNGMDCEPVTGCECVGADCGRLYPDPMFCYLVQERCFDAVISCGGLADEGCPPEMFCDYPEETYCGGFDIPGVCRLRPDGCPDPGGIPVCGCDGRDYLSECSANLAGTDVAFYGGCDGE